MRPSIVAQYKNAIRTYAEIYFILAEHAIFVVEILVYAEIGILVLLLLV